MKSIKNIALSAMLTIGAFSMVTYTSCNKDQCKDVVCQNGGTCNAGACVCPSGYEGNLCQTTTRAKFIGTWSASDVDPSTPTPFVYTAAVAGGTLITQITLGNFSDGFFNNAVVATVSGNTVTIASQQPDNDNYFVEGAATLGTDGKLTWTYKLTNPSNVVRNYTGTWSK